MLYILLTNLKLIMLYPKNHLTLYFKWVNCMCELYLNKAVFKLLFILQILVLVKITNLKVLNFCSNLILVPSAENVHFNLHTSLFVSLITYQFLPSVIYISNRGSKSIMIS